MVLLCTVVFFLLGVTMATATEWVAIAAVAVVDFDLLVVFAGVHPLPHRAEIYTLLSVHGVCTSVGSWWSRSVRNGKPAVRAKASEAGRVLAAGWIVIFMLRIAAAGEPSASATLPDSTLIGVFIVTAISVVMGAGYTKYAEAKEVLPGPPAPDPLSHARRAAGRPFRHLLHWHTRYSDSF
jgi:hypothetical protein